MNSSFYKSTSYIPPGGTEEKERRREMELKAYTKAQNNRPTMLEEAEAHQASHSHPSTNYPGFLDPSHASTQRPSRVSIGDGTTEQEIRRMSGQFNAPTHIEVQRETERKKRHSWKRRILESLK